MLLNIVPQQQSALSVSDTVLKHFTSLLLLNPCRVAPVTAQASDSTNLTGIFARCKYCLCTECDKNVSDNLFVIFWATT